MSRAAMTGLAVAVALALVAGVAVNVALVVFSVRSTQDVARLQGQVGELTSLVTSLNRSLLGASASSDLKLESLNNSLLGISTSSDLKFESLNNSLLSSQTEFASRVDTLEQSTVRLTSCQRYRDNGATRSGLYVLYLQDGGAPLPVYCDLQSDQHGWLVFQRRVDGSEDFYRTWADYKAGFGRLEAEFWLGNDKLHRLTSAGLTELRVDLGDWENNTAFALYSSFSVAGEEDNYTLSVSGYSGTAGDSLGYHDGMAFTTKDADHDTLTGNCAVSRTGAWWYWYCDHSNLNGHYYTGGPAPAEKGVVWDHWKGNKYSLKSVQMKLRQP